MAAEVQYDFLVGLLIAVLGLELTARRFGLPPAAALIVGGIALALIPAVPSFTIEPSLVMIVFLPPLLMNGGYFTPWRDFRENFIGIALLAVGAVAFTTLVVGWTSHALVPGLPWAACFALGAIVSPPDAVAANAILERLSLPARMTALLQGESLINDASGLVLLKFAVAAALTGAFSAPAALGTFAYLVLGGVAVGTATAVAGTWVLRRLRASELAILVTLLLSVLSYGLAERLGASGVLAVVATGLIVGRRQHTVLSAAVRIRAAAFWKVLVFALESLLFIFIGLSLREVVAEASAEPDVVKGLLLPVTGVVVAVVATRFVWLVGTFLGRTVLRRLGAIGGPEPSLAMATVMSWAGMRGAVTLAAALSLATDFPGRSFILASAFAVIVVTVLLQGMTLNSLVRALGLSGEAEEEALRDSEERAWARTTAAQFETIRQLSASEDGQEKHPRLVEQYGKRAQLAADFVGNRDDHLSTKAEHEKTVIAAVRAGRRELLRLHAAGEIHDRVLHSIEGELDLQQLVAESSASNRGG